MLHMRNTCIFRHIEFSFRILGMKLMPSRKNKSRQKFATQIKEAAYVFTFPVLMLIWAVQSYS